MAAFRSMVVFMVAFAKAMASLISMAAHFQRDALPSSACYDEEEDLDSGALKRDVADACTTIPVYKAHIGEAEVCVVCLADFAAGQNLRSLPCQHRYHQQCIDPWLRRVSECPLCKCEVTFSSHAHVMLSPLPMRLPR